MKKTVLTLFLLLFFTSNSSAGSLDNIKSSQNISSKIRGLYVNANDNIDRHYVILDKATCTASNGNVVIGKNTKKNYYLYFMDNDKFLRDVILATYTKGNRVTFRIGPVGNKGYNKILYIVTPDDTNKVRIEKNKIKAKNTPVTLYWHIADNADVYLNGKPLRSYNPSFKTRGDEAPLPAFSAKAILKNGDIFTVGGRRGGSYGFMLIAVDNAGKIVFKTDSNNWNVYHPGKQKNWFSPSVAMTSLKDKVSVQPNPWYPQKELNRKFNNAALSVWGKPSDKYSYLIGTVKN